MTESRPTDTATTDRRPLPLEAALERVGDRWSLLLVEALLDGPRRFGELGDALPGIAPNILTDRLRRLERDRDPALDALPGAPDAASRTSSRPTGAHSPRRSVCSPTGGPAVPAMSNRCATPLCGTALEARWFCPTCSAVVDAADANEERIL